MTTDPDQRLYLRLRDVSKTFPGVRALNAVDFELRAGEIHALVGENGAGKSTLVKILSGAFQPDSGSIEVAGHPVSLTSPRDAQRLGIATIYQDVLLVPSLSAAANVVLGHEPMRGPFVDRVATRHIAGRLLGRLGAQFSPDAMVSRLGSADRQLVEIAKALALDARILILDEPTAALTGRETDRLFKILRQLRSDGLGIIYITHRLAELSGLVDRVTVFRDGSRVATIPGVEATHDRVIRLMIGRTMGEMYPKAEVGRGAPLLSAVGLTRSGWFEDVSISVFAGEIVGLAGLVGSGRTELARCLYGLHAVDGGEVFRAGKKIRLRSPRQALAAGIAYLPSDRRAEGLVTVLSVRHNIGLSSIPRFSPLFLVDRRAEAQAAQSLVRQLRIATPSVEQFVRFLSGGNQQKTVLAKLLCRGAQVFIFDEPTLGVDVGAKVEIYGLLNELVANGAGVLIISSDTLELLGMSDRVVVMSGGRVTGELSAEEATEERIISLAFAGANSLAAAPSGGRS